MKKSYAFFAVLFFVLSASCGSTGSVSQGKNPIIEENPIIEDKPCPDTDPCVQERLTNSVFMFATDFFSEGQLYTANYISVSDSRNTGVIQLGSSAVVRSFGGKLYVLSDAFSIGSSDNVTILNPTNGFAVEGQWSTGNGTNPQDIVVIGNKAYISLYSPEFDSANVDADGNPADVIVMSLSDGSIIKRLSFHQSLNNDGKLTARAARMLLVGNRLYVGIQDLDGDSFEQNTNGKIGVIDIPTDTVEDVIVLQGRNPVDLAYSAGENKLYAALQAPFDNVTFENLYATSSFGGIEIVPLDDTANTILINDDDLGGYVEKTATGGAFVFAVVSQMDLVTFSFTSDIFRMDENNEAVSGLSKFIEGSNDVRAIGIDGDNRLWISRRSIVAGEGQADSKGVDVFEIETGAQVGSTLTSVVPVTSIAFGNL